MQTQSPHEVVLAHEQGHGDAVKKELTVYPSLAFDEQILLDHAAEVVVDLFIVPFLSNRPYFYLLLVYFFYDIVVEERIALVSDCVYGNVSVLSLF